MILRGKRFHSCTFKFISSSYLDSAGWESEKFGKNRYGEIDVRNICLDVCLIYHQN